MLTNFLWRMSLKPTPPKEREDLLIDFEELYFQKDSSKDVERTSREKRYLAFSRFMQNCLISEHGYIVDTGNYETVNLELMDRLNERIEKHPILWKFFMVG